MGKAKAVLFFLLWLSPALLMSAAYIVIADRVCPVESASKQHGQYHESPAGERANIGSNGYQNGAALLLAAFKIAESSPGEQKSHTDTTQQNQKSERWVTKFFCEAKALDVALVIFTYCLVIVTGWLVYATVGLHRETASLAAFAEQQSKDMQETIRIGIGANQIAVANTERQLRAYVTVPSVLLTERRFQSVIGAYGLPIQGALDTLEMKVVFRNGGQSPATRVIYRVSSGEIPFPFRADFNFPDTGIVGYGLIGPNSEIHSPVLSNKAATFEKTSDGHRWLLWGWIEYDDVFDGTSRHRTEFCFEMAPRRLPINNDLTIDFDLFPEYNNMDRDCVRPYWPHERVYSQRRPGT